MFSLLRNSRASGWLLLAIALPIAVPYGIMFVRAVTSTPARALELIGDDLLKFVLSVALCVAPLAVLPLRTRTFARWANVGLTLLLAVNLVHVLEYRELITLGAIDAIASTTVREALEFARARPMTMSLAGVGFVAVMGIAECVSRRVPAGHAPRLGDRGVLFLVGLLAVIYVGANPVRLFPVSTFKNIADYIQYRERIVVAQAARDGHTFGATRMALEDEPRLIVVVLGESQRRDRLGIYGYDRDTTPNLASLDSLIVYRDAVSAASSTQAAVKSIMTAANASNVVDHSDGSIIQLANEVGYRTVWISNQDRTDDTEIAAIASQADEVEFTNHSWSAGGRYDHEVLPFVAREVANADGPLLLFVHLVGSHDDYSLRYPARFARFDGSSPAPSFFSELRPAQRSTSDHYDNSVYYSDAIIGDIIRQVESTETSAAVVYLSDHGENVYDAPHRMMGHGSPLTTRYEVEVPLVFWTSPALRAREPRLVSALTSNAGDPISTADLFGTLGDLIGAEWPSRDPSRSLASATYASTTRLVRRPQGDVVDYDLTLAEGSMPTAER